MFVRKICVNVALGDTGSASNFIRTGISKRVLGEYLKSSTDDSRDSIVLCRRRDRSDRLSSDGLPLDVLTRRAKPAKYAD